MNDLDPILNAKLERFCLKPIRYQELFDLYKNHQQLFWVAEEIHLSEDIPHWKSLTDDERFFIKHVLAFFASSDGIVNENIATRFHDEVKIPEARAFYTIQMFMETVHSETYSLLIETLTENTKEMHELFAAIETMPIVNKKARWALEWIDSDASFAERLIAFACVEGVFFSSSFASIYWLKDRGLMPGLSFSNDLISRDEALHTDFAVALHKTLQPQNQATQEIAHKIFRNAVDIEIEFATISLPVSLIGMNADLMADYIRYCADRLLSQLGFDKLYNVDLPLDFMELISLPNKGNFHERKNGEYRKFVKTSKTADDDDKFNIDFDF